MISVMHLSKNKNSGGKAEFGAMDTATPMYQKPNSAPATWALQRLQAQEPTYTDVNQIEFGITGKKKVDKNLEVVYVGNAAWTEELLGQ